MNEVQLTVNVKKLVSVVASRGDLLLVTKDYAICEVMLRIASPDSIIMSEGLKNVIDMNFRWNSL